MLDNFIYQNHLGKKFVGLENNVYLNYNDLRDYSWSYDTINNRISRFYKGISNRKIPLIVHCNSDEEAVEIKNRIHEIAEADVEALREGKIYIGNYYTKGYITASAKSDYLISKRLCKLDLTLTSENPDWYKETVYVYPKIYESGTIEFKGLDYPYDYNYDYTLMRDIEKIVCNSIRGNSFKILIFGYVENPTIIIGNHTYKIDGTVGKGEILQIDSLSKTITLTTESGVKVNWFDKRNRDSYIFEPIPSGINEVYWDGTFGFNLTVIEKRSEPKWT